MIQRKPLNKEQALQKMRQYCGYQERSLEEIKQKLFSSGVEKKDSDEIVCRLIEENYLNEERYARLFAGGKFRQKQWGRNKIKYELRQKKISDPSIEAAIKEIDEPLYQKTLQKLARSKWESHENEMDILIKQRKVCSYLLHKGYEHSLVLEAVRDISSTLHID
jgi:regulatory protein